MSKVISQQIEKTQSLVEGLKNKIELVRNKGLDEEFIKKLDSDNQLMDIYNNDLDKMKTELKARTIRANKKMIEIKNQVREAKKVVKRDFNQPQWKEFGIIDKR